MWGKHFKRYRHEPGNPQSLLQTFVMAVYADSQENIWVGSPLGLTRIDGKSGEYSFFRKPGRDPANLSNTTSIVEDRSGYLWFGTYGGGLKRYDPRTGRFAAFRHNPADPHSLSHDIVYSLMVDHRGILWVGTDNGLNRCEDPVTGRFRSWKGDPADPSQTDVRAMVEDSNGVLWLVSSSLERFDPATGRFTAYTFDPLGTGTAGRKDSPVLVKVGRRIAEDSFLAIDHSGVLWVATANGLLRFDREREQFTMYDERDGLPAGVVNGILEDRNGNLWVSTAGVDLVLEQRRQILPLPFHGGDPLRGPPVASARPRRRKRNRPRNPHGGRTRRTLGAAGDARTRKPIRREVGVLERSGGGHRSGIDRAGRDRLRGIQCRLLFVLRRKPFERIR